MPVLIPHIDTIAPKKGRDVPYLTCHSQFPRQSRENSFAGDPTRAKVLSWLDAHGEAGFRKRRAEDF